MKKLQKQLKEANHQLQAYKGGHRGKKKVGGKKDMERLIKNKVRCELWRTIKFITHTSKRERLRRNLGMLNLRLMKVTHPAQAARENWCRIYESVVMSEINKCRTYVIGRIHEAVFEYKDTHEGEFPPLDLWKLCASREIRKTI
jgi:hypothetical protein